MGRKLSNSELTSQIASEGRHWGLRPMVSMFGDTLVSEEIPCKIPLTDSLSIVENVQRDITGISQEFTWSMFLRGRLKGNKKQFISTALEIKQAVEEKQHKSKIDDAYYELTSDIRRLNRITVGYR